MARGKRAVDQAIEFLSAGIAEGVWRFDRHLPSLAELATASRVSRGSMWKAVRRLSDDGILDVVTGGYITIRQQDHGATAVATDHALTWEKKRDMLARDIIDGRYTAAGRLPRCNELTATYGVCNATMKKMLDSLVGRGIISREKKAFVVPVSKKRRFQSTIVLLSESLSSNRSAVVISERMQRLVDALEAECARAGLSLKVEIFDLGKPDAYRRAMQGFRRDDSIIGYLFSIFWWEPQSRMTRIRDFLDLATIHKKPVAAFDIVGEFSLLPGPTSRGLLHLFRTAGFSAGQSVARLLLKQGHRHVAFMSLHHEHAWSVQRLAGMIDLYAAAGLASNVRTFCEAEFDDNVDPVYAAFENDSSALRMIFKFRTARERHEWQIARYRKISARKRSPAIDAQTLSEVRNDFMALKALVGKNMSPNLFTDIRQHTLFALGNRVLDAYAEPLFELALALPNVTAWVGSNDHLAQAAQRFLDKKGIAVPAKIAVAGFDNQVSSFESRLTSYDFNMAAIAHRMLRFVLRPDDRANIAQGGMTEVDGLIFERESTGRAHGATVA